MIYFKGVSQPVEDIFLPDGVHFNSDGVYKIYRAVRGVGIRAAQDWIVGSGIS